MSFNETPNQKAFASIQYYNGQILGAVLWIPASIFEKFIEPGEVKVEVTFEENRIFIGNEDTTGKFHPQMNISIVG